MVSQTSNPQEGGSFIPQRGTAPSTGNKTYTIPSNTRADQRIEPDYFTKGGIMKPSLPTTTKTNVPNVPVDSKDMKNQKADRGELDHFVGQNNLKSRADAGKVGVQQFFGLESSY